MAGAASPHQNSESLHSPIRFSLPQELPATVHLLPHQAAVSLFDTLSNLCDAAHLQETRLDMILNLEADCGDEDSALERVKALDLPNERSQMSDDSLFIEEADPVGLGSHH